MRIYRIQAIEDSFGCYLGPINSAHIGICCAHYHVPPSKMNLSKEISNELAKQSFNYYFDSLDKLFNVFYSNFKTRCMKYFNVVYLDINDELIENKTALILEDNQIAVREFFSTENFKVIPWDNVSHMLKNS